MGGIYFLTPIFGMVKKESRVDGSEKKIELSVEGIIVN